MVEFFRNNNYRQPTDQQNPLRRMLVKIGIAVAILAILASMAFALKNQVTTGGLTVKTGVDHAGIIAIWSRPGNGEAENAKPTVTSTIRLQNGKSTRLKPGMYLVQVTVNDKVVASETVSLKWGRSTTVTLNPKSASLAGLEPVASANTRSFSLDKTNLSYLDQQTKNIYTIDNQNHISQISSVQFDQVYWADAGFGIGQDADGLLYVVNHSSVTPLANTPFTPNKTTLISVAPDHTVYIAKDKDIYRGTTNGGFIKVFTLEGAPLQLFAGTSKKFAVQYRAEAEAAESSSEADIVTVDDTTKLAEKELDTYEAAWSPSAKYFVVTSDSGTLILDDKLKMVTAAPNNNVNSPVWLDDNTLFYGIADQLWRYDVTSGKSERIAEGEKEHYIVAIVPDPSQSYLYLSMTGARSSNDYLVLQRYSLKGKAPSSEAQKVSKYLPVLTGSDCLLSLTNFLAVKPTINLYGSQSQAACTQVARDYVADRGASSDSFTYATTGVAAQSPPNN